MLKDHIFIATGMAAIQDIKDLFLHLLVQQLETQLFEELGLIQFLCIGDLLALLTDEGPEGADPVPPPFLEIKF